MGCARELAIHPADELFFLLGGWLRGGLAHKVEAFAERCGPEGEGLGALELGEVLGAGEGDGDAGEEVEMVGDAREVLLLEEVGGLEELGVAHVEDVAAGLEVVGDVLHLLEGEGGAVGDGDGLGRDLVEQVAQDLAGLEGVVEVAVGDGDGQHRLDPLEDVFAVLGVELELRLDPDVVLQLGHRDLGRRVGGGGGRGGRGGRGGAGGAGG